MLPTPDAVNATIGIGIFAAGGVLFGAGFKRLQRAAREADEYYADKVALKRAAVFGKVRDDLLDVVAELYERLDGDSANVDATSRAVGFYDKSDEALEKLGRVWLCEHYLGYIKTLHERVSYYMMGLGLGVILTGLTVMFVPSGWIFGVVLEALLFSLAWIIFCFRNQRRLNRRERSLEAELTGALHKRSAE